MSERFVGFDSGEYMFCYDVCNNARVKKVGYGSLSFFIRTRYNM